MTQSQATNGPRRSTIRSIATLLSGTVVAQIIGIATMPLLSRVYGPTAFGILAIFLSLTAVVSTVAALRYEFAIVLPENEEDARQLRQLAIAIVSAISLITITATVVIFFLTGSGDREWWLLLIGGSVFIAGVTNTWFYWMIRARRYRVQSTSRVVQAIVSAASQAALGLFVAPRGEWLIVGYVIGQAAGMVVLVAKNSSTPRVRPNLHEWWRLMVRYRKMPFFNAPNALVDALRLNCINIIIGSRSVQALGQFSMAWKLASGPTSLLANAISQVYFPNMAAAVPGTLHRLVKSITIRALALGFLPMLGLALVAPRLVPWFLGSQWEQAGFIVQALAPYLYLTIATAPLSTVFIVTERQGTMLIFAVVYLLVPLTALALAGSDVVRGAWILSGAMTVPLMFLIFLAHHVAKRSDLERKRRPGEQRDL